MRLEKKKRRLEEEERIKRNLEEWKGVWEEFSRLIGETDVYHWTSRYYMVKDFMRTYGETGELFLRIPMPFHNLEIRWEDYFRENFTPELNDFILQRYVAEYNRAPPMLVKIFKQQDGIAGALEMLKWRAKEILNHDKEEWQHFIKGSKWEDMKFSDYMKLCELCKTFEEKKMKKTEQKKDIKSTKDFLAFIFGCMRDLKNGTMTVNEAIAQSKLASQANTALKYELNAEAKGERYFDESK